MCICVYLYMFTYVCVPVYVCMYVCISCYLWMDCSSGTAVRFEGLNFDVMYRDLGELYIYIYVNLYIDGLTYTNLCIRICV
jgi:hypothetical protein